MTAYSTHRTGPPPLTNLLSAATVSLAAVTGFTVLLGVIFLPAEARQLRPAQHVSVTNMLLPQPDAPGAALFWSIPQTGTPGWCHHLLVGGLERPLKSSDGTSLQPLTIARVPITNHILIGDWDGSLHILNSGQPAAKLRLLGRQADGGVVDVVVSHDGRRALSQNAFSLYGWDLAAEQRIWRRTDLCPTCLYAIPDRDAALVGEANGDLLEIDLSTGDTLRQLAHFDSPLLAMATSPRSDMLAALTADGKLQLLDRHTLAPQWIVPTGWHTASGRFIAFSPADDALVTTDPQNPRMLAVWNLAERTQVGRFVGHENIVLGAAFSADGVLWSWGADATIRSWNVSTHEPLNITHVSLSKLWTS